MRIISTATINKYIQEHSDSETGLIAWKDAIKNGAFYGLNDLKQVFPKIDAVGRGYVFNISGNNYRLAASVHFNTQTLYIREIMTHAEYSKNAWKKRHQDFR